MSVNSERRPLEVRRPGETPAWTGFAVDLTATEYEVQAIRRAVTTDGGELAVDAPTPSRWWTSLGVPSDGTPPLTRLVAAARSRGVRVPEERALAAAERKLGAAQRAVDTHAVEATDLAAARERLATAGADVRALRERMAAARGRLEARTEAGMDTDAAEEAVRDAAARLSEAETERLAAEQAHETAQRRARDARSARERRLRLQDRVANRRRDARRTLVDELVDEFDAAVRAVPGEASLSLDPLAVDGDRVTAALAAARLADLRAPIVDDTGRFPSAAAAADRLDALVVRC